MFRFTQFSEGQLEERTAVMRPVWEVADFIRTVGRRLRFGALSRSSLQLLRLELQGPFLECDWMVRPADPWDADLAARERERTISEQALRDAISIRELLFASLPYAETAVLRAFRSWAVREEPELVIGGAVTRDAQYVFRVNSLVMRAKLYGFQFELNNGILQRLELKDSNFSFQQGFSISKQERRAKLCPQ